MTRTTTIMQATTTGIAGPGAIPSEILIAATPTAGTGSVGIAAMIAFPSRTGTVATLASPTTPISAARLMPRAGLTETGAFSQRHPAMTVTTAAAPARARTGTTTVRPATQAGDARFRVWGV